MKKIIALLLIVTMSVAMLTGCGGSDEPEDTQDATTGTEDESSQTGDEAEVPAELSDEVITVAVEGEPNSLVPDVAFLGNYISTINRLVYEPLIISDYETLELFDTGLVTAWEHVDDTHIRLTLREGVKFHNGEEFTSEDVYYQFEQGLQGAQTDHYGLFDIDEFEVEDDYNIIVGLKEPWAQAVELMSFNTFMALSKIELEAAGGAATTDQYLENAGTGKYRFKEWVPGEYIELERNENYWDQDNLGYFAGYKFVFINDATARGMAVQSGDADLSLDIPVSNYDLYNTDDSVSAQILETNTVNTLFLNSGNGGPFEDAKVREAVYWLINKEAIRQIGNSGFGKITDTVISPDGPMFDGIVESEGKEVDVEKAKELLADAGYADGLDVKLRAMREDPVNTLIQEQLRAGGINVSIEIAELPVHFEGLAAGDYDIYASAQQFGYYSEPVRTTDGLKYDYSDVMGGCGYESEELSEIAARCYATLDIDARKEAYADYQAYFRENHVSVGIYTNVGLAVSRPDLENLNLFGVGVVDLSNLYSTGK